MCKNQRVIKMNWNKAISYGAGAIAVISFSIVCIKSCSDGKDVENLKKVNETIRSANETIKKSRKLIHFLDEENKALRDSVIMWRDSTEIYRDSTAFYKDAWQDCEKDKRCIRKTKPVKTKPAPVPTTKPVRQPEPEKENNYNGTKIDLRDSSRNSSNIIVRNNESSNNNTEIILGSGAVNEGNIIVNNGGNVTVNDNNKSEIDSLRRAIDSLSQKESRKSYSAASSVVLIKRVKTYRRTR